MTTTVLFVITFVIWVVGVLGLFGMESLLRDSDSR
jgi:hypothetical protein